MNNLYDKIYEAINTGIQKALIINDNQSEDTSINWHERKIKSELNTIPYNVSRLLSGENTKEVYKEIINTYDRSGVRYKVKSIDELYDLYNVICGFYGIKGLGWKNVRFDWIDCSDAVMIILIDGSEIPLNLFDKTIHIPKWIELKNLKDCNHSIILHKNVLSEIHQWQVECIDPDIFDNSDCITNLAFAISDYNGYEHTYNNANIKYNERMTAFNRVTSAIESDDYKGYLPAIGELWFLMKRQDLINYILFKIGSPQSIDLVRNQYYSSTEHSFANVCTVWKKQIHLAARTLNTIYILPLFKKV